MEVNYTDVLEIVDIILSDSVHITYKVKRSGQYYLINVLQRLYRCEVVVERIKLYLGKGVKLHKHQSI